RRRADDSVEAHLAGRAALQVVVAAARVLADRRASEVLDALLARAAAHPPTAALVGRAAPAIGEAGVGAVRRGLASSVEADEAGVAVARGRAGLRGRAGAVASREEAEGEEREEEGKAGAHHGDDDTQNQRPSRQE